MKNVQFVGRVMNKTTVLYHQDADGFGSAFAIWLKLKDTANYIGVQYSQPVPEIPEGTEQLLIVDFSYSREICEDLNSKYSVTIFDHHRTAEKELEGLAYANFDMTQSGCAMVWKAYHDAPLPELLMYVQDRDLWKFELPSSKEVNLYIATLEHDFYIWDRVCFLDGFMPMARQSGEAIQKFQDGQIKRALKDVREMLVIYEDKYYQVPVVNCSSNVSEVGNILCKEFPDAPFSATYCDRKDVRSWSLRSVGDFDVSTIAKMFGGGGHKNAAGFSTDLGWPQTAPDEFLKEFFKRQDGEK